MRLLLDSNILFWAIVEPEKLSAQVSALLLDEANEVWVSSVSLAELQIKQRIGKIKLPVTLDEEIVALGFGQLTFRFEHAHWLSELPLHHRDPFDRMIIAQAITSGFTILTSDQKFTEYPAEVILN